jgi:hypothetical protein
VCRRGGSMESTNTTPCAAFRGRCAVGGWYEAGGESEQYPAQQCGTGGAAEGPSSILYGRQALCGAINIIRKKPQAAKALRLLLSRRTVESAAGWRRGEWVIPGRRRCRMDTSFEHDSPWRAASTDRFYLSPSLTWLIMTATG